MSHKISPQEFFFQETLNPCHVQTTVPMEDIEQDINKMLVPHIRHYNLPAGSEITIQIMNKDKDVLLWEADFRVTAALEAKQEISSDYGSRVVVQKHYEVERWTEWKSTNVGMSTIPVEEPVESKVEYAPSNAELKWSYKEKAWDVVIDEKVWTTVTRHDGESKDEFKQRALDTALGSRQKVA